MPASRPLPTGLPPVVAERAAAAEFILEGLWAHKRIGRSEERGFFAEQQRQQRPGATEPPQGGRPRRQFN